MNDSQHPARKKVLSVFSLVMITIGSVDSIRNLPATALFGSQLIFFFSLGAIFFLLPSALISAELSSTWPRQGGVYLWVKKAFGSHWGFFAIWLQWIENVIWYPTILSFVAGSIGYLISPSIAGDKLFLTSVILVSFWGATIVNLYGMKQSARFSSLCTISGLLIPMTLIIGFGSVWLFSGKPVQISFDSQALLPNMTDTNMWVALTGIMLSFCGVEIATVHAADVKNPQKAFPKALLIAVLVILFTLILGSLAIAIVIPNNEISLVAGIMEAFDAFFSAYHLHGILPLIAAMLVLGGLGSVNNWIIAPTTGLLVAAKDGHLPKQLQRENRHGAPVALLIYQAIIVSLLTSVFLLMPSVNGSYWLLTALAAQLYMMMYLFMFAAAVVLRIRHADVESAFKVPGGVVGLSLVALFGIIGTITTIVVGFIPPSNINVGSATRFDGLLLLGLVIMCLPPLLPWLLSKHQKQAPLEEAVDIG